MRTRNILLTAFIVFLFSGVTVAQNCLDAKGQLDFNSAVSLYQGDYKLISVKEVKMNSGKTLAINIEFSTDYDYLIGLVCSSNVQATGIELRDNLGTLMNYNINYNAFKNNETILEFSTISRKGYRVLVNAIDKNGSEICGKVFIMAKERNDDKGLKRKTAVSY